MYYQRKYAEAADERVKILDFADLDPDVKAAYAMRAVIDYAVVKDFEKSRAVAAKLSELELQKDSNKHNLAYHKAYALNREGKYDEAHAVIDAVIKDTDPASGYRYNLDMQKIAAHQGKKEYQAVIDAFPDSYIETVNAKRQYLYYYQRGIALYLLKKYEDAIAEFDKSLKANPKYGIAHYYKGACYSRLGENDKALAAYEDMKNSSNSTWTQFQSRYNSAQVLYKQGENQKSADLCKEIYENPKMPARNKGYALYYSYYPLMKLEKKDEAKANLEKLIELKGAAGSHKKTAKKWLEKLQ